MRRTRVRRHVRGHDVVTILFVTTAEYDAAIVGAVTVNITITPSRLFDSTPSHCFGVMVNDTTDRLRMVWRHYITVIPLLFATWRRHWRRRWLLDGHAIMAVTLPRIRCCCNGRPLLRCGSGINTPHCHTLRIGEIERFSYMSYRCQHWRIVRWSFGTHCLRGHYIVITANGWLRLFGLC